MRIPFMFLQGPKGALGTNRVLTPTSTQLCLLAELYTMSTQYNQIGSRYKAFKNLPAVDLEEPSVLKRLGDINGLKCLDLACGLGHCE